MTREVTFYANEHSDYMHMSDDVTSSAAVSLGSKIIFNDMTWLINYFDQYCLPSSVWTDFPC